MLLPEYNDNSLEMKVSQFRKIQSNTKFSLQKGLMKHINLLPTIKLYIKENDATTEIYIQEIKKITEIQKFNTFFTKFYIERFKLEKMFYEDKPTNSKGEHDEVYCKRLGEIISYLDELREEE